MKPVDLPFPEELFSMLRERVAASGNKIVAMVFFGGGTPAERILGLCEVNPTNMSYQGVYLSVVMSRDTDIYDCLPYWQRFALILSDPLLILCQVELP